MRVEDDITQVPDDPTSSVVPIKFLSSRLCKKVASTISQILEQWDSLPESLTTWVEAEDLHRRFPEVPAWGQAGFQPGRNVRIKYKARRNTVSGPTTDQAKSDSG